MGSTRAKTYFIILFAALFGTGAAAVFRGEFSTAEKAAMTAALAGVAVLGGISDKLFRGKNAFAGVLLGGFCAALLCSCAAAVFILLQNLPELASYLPPVVCASLPLALLGAVVLRRALGTIDKLEGPGYEKYKFFDDR